MNTFDTLSCLIIGCGNIAGGFDSDGKSGQFPLTHAGAYKQHGGFNFLACVDPNPEVRNAFMRRWHVKEGHDSMDALRQHVSQIDVVSICSPTSFHLADVRVALGLRPRVIFCEKPLASNPEDAEALVAECERASVPLIVNYNRRWDPSVIQLKHELESGAWGQVRSVSGVYTRGVSNNGSHMVDLLHLLLGPIRLTGVGMPVFDGFQDDPSVPLFLQSESGVPVVISCGYACDYSLFELQIVTEFGVISMEDGGMAWRLRRAFESSMFRNYRSLDSGLERVTGNLRGAMLAAVDDVCRVAHGEHEKSSTGDNALAAIRICDQAKQLSIEKAANVTRNLEN
jgi:predicted dehydrogenase